MIEGVMRHSTEMSVEKNYVDSHGQSEVAFAFCHLFGFELLPRLKGITKKKLYRPESGQPDAYPNFSLPPVALVHQCKELTNLRRFDFHIANLVNDKAVIRQVTPQDLGVATIGHRLEQFLDQLRESNEVPR